MLSGATVCIILQEDVAYVETVVPSMLYSTYPLPIKAEKAQDLTKLVKSYVPHQYHSFYTVLPNKRALTLMKTCNYLCQTRVHVKHSIFLA